VYWNNWSNECWSDGVLGISEPIIQHSITPFPSFHPGHSRQSFEENRKIFSANPMPRAVVSNSLVIAVVAAARRVAAHFESEQKIFLHHVDIKPGFGGHLQNKRPAVFHHRRRDDAVEQHFDGGFPRDAAFLRQQYTFAKSKHLNRQTQIGAIFIETARPLAPT